MPRCYKTLSHRILIGLRVTHLMAEFKLMCGREKGPDMLRHAT